MTEYEKYKNKMDAAQKNLNTSLAASHEGLDSAYKLYNAARGFLDNALCSLDSSNDAIADFSDDFNTACGDFDTTLGVLDSDRAIAYYVYNAACDAAYDDLADYESELNKKEIK